MGRFAASAEERRLATTLSFFMSVISNPQIRIECGSDWMSARALRLMAIATNSHLRGQPRTCGIKGFLVCLKNQYQNIKDRE
jgi:hypothetical protein